MQALDEPAIRRAMVNCSRSELAALTAPRDLADTDWSQTPVYGWRDPKAPLRGYLIGDGDDGPVGVAVRAAESRMSVRRSAMCLLCRTVLTADRVSLFSARRAGSAGRNGDTVGTYVCADLACASRVREVPRGLLSADEELQQRAVADQVAGLRDRFTAFVADVLRA